MAAASETAIRNRSNDRAKAHVAQSPTSTVARCGRIIRDIEEVPVEHTAPEDRCTYCLPS